jgi:hypothetical protein
MKYLILILLTTSFCFGAEKDPIKVENRQAMKSEWQVHHSQVTAERDRHRSEVRQILADDPEKLKKFEDHWTKVDAERSARVAERKEQVKVRVQERKQERKGK